MTAATTSAADGGWRVLLMIFQNLWLIRAKGSMTHQRRTTHWYSGPCSSRPERANQRRVSPLQGLVAGGPVFPGRCPWADDRLHLQCDCEQVDR